MDFDKEKIDSENSYPAGRTNSVWGLRKKPHISLGRWYRKHRSTNTPNIIDVFSNLPAIQIDLSTEVGDYCARRYVESNWHINACGHSLHLHDSKWSTSYIGEGPHSHTRSNVVLKKFTPAPLTPPPVRGVPFVHPESGKPGRCAPIRSAYKPPSLRYPRKVSGVFAAPPYVLING